MKYLKNNRGHALVLILWIMLILMAMLVIIVNIGKAFTIKEQASIGAEHAAFAATAEIVEKVTEGIQDFDDDPLFEIGEDGVEIPTDTGRQRIADFGKSIEELMEEQKTVFINQGRYKNEAYIMAMNHVLSSRIGSYPSLKSKIGSKYNSVDYSAAISFVLIENDIKVDKTTIFKPSSSNKWRVKIEVKVTFESINDDKYVSSFEQDIKQVGYGPKLLFLDSL